MAMPSTLPRLIATDLDGTLLDSTGMLRTRTGDALRAAADAGIIVVFASGRPPFVAQDAIDRTARAVSYGVMANGSMTCTLPDATMLHRITFDAATAFDAIRVLRAADSRFGFALATDRGFSNEAGFDERMPVHQGIPAVADVIEAHVGATEAFKLLVFHHVLTAHELTEQIPAILGRHLAVSHMGAEAVEVGPAGADKGVGLRWLCQHIDVDPAETLVFGDEVNDLPMFAVAGTAVAMANGHAAVRAAATTVTSSNDDDGVAVYIEQLLR
jgi:Cof subfamily protein (haloacid dehalogenase superfamily)